MNDPLSYSIVGLQEFIISFENYCNPCDIQQYCKYGQENPFTVKINCNDLNRSKEKIKSDQFQELQKKADTSLTYDDLIKKVKINLTAIFSKLWKEKIKANKEEIRCLDSRKTDPMLVTQQGQDWWQDFSSIMKEINKECEKIL
ncbi:MAG: hypothetical protein GF329_17855 [Candidatus Lokiarchaeota archaeon]|nr:hypothetical protein [Candidatus Lokiarchaeota archaeon]